MGRSDYERIQTRVHLRARRAGPWTHQGEYLDCLVAPETLMLVHEDARTILLADDLLGLAREASAGRAGLVGEEEAIDTVGVLIAWLAREPWTDASASVSHGARWEDLDGPLRLRVDRSLGGGRFASASISVSALIACACDQRPDLRAATRTVDLTSRLHAPRALDAPPGAARMRAC